MLFSRSFKHCLIGFFLLFSTASHAGLITNIASETISYPISTGIFGWNASYDIGFVNQDLLIDVDVYLTGYEPGSALRDIWEDGIESIWTNAFDLSDGTYFYDTVFNVDWLSTNVGADHTVTVIKGNGNVNLTRWYTGRPSGYSYSRQGVIAAHEFGHMIGLFDEYTGGALDPVTELIRADSIMGQNLTSPQIDHFDAFLEWAQVNSGVAALTLVADRGVDNYFVSEPSSLGVLLLSICIVFAVKYKSKRSEARLSGRMMFA
ncbi:hypothetical protein R1T43_02435 [Alteromonas sp. CI.11.F.A3]|uniref:hypothetical protein n=1 Tax=Alteromonas sp. CI.11.F.A3 TaxID=3079555 RepID=UPI0029420AD6|nr:hypothetical protein [Alteromonas sp. CI.11.F.A3]WOI37922.1 hypothetical protein R1T43_02435 [Alteromonas sp. CI.11.F.A3]